MQNLEKSGNDNIKLPAKNQKKTATTTKIIWGLLGLFLIVMVTSQVYIRFFYNPIKLEEATLYDFTSSVMFKGVVVRNEKYVTYNGSGVISFTNTNGAKLAKNSVIANIYKDEHEKAAMQQIAEKEEQIKILTDAENLVGTDNSQLESFSNQIYDKHLLLEGAINGNKYEDIATIKQDYLNLQCKKQIVKGAVNNFQAKITQLENEIATLKAAIPNQPSLLTITDTGYFLSSTDGYEMMLNKDNVDTLTKGQIEGIIKTPKKEMPSNVIGKVVDDYKWKFVAILDNAKTEGIYEKQVCKLQLGETSDFITASIESIKKQEDNTSIVVFQCDNMLTSVNRVLQFKLLLEDYKGIRIPTSAIAFDENNEKGVYVKSGVEIGFRKIKEVKTFEDYILVEDTTDLSGYVSLYDNVVVAGKDLYDGKIVL